MKDWRTYAKAIVAGIAATVGALLLVVQGNETLADVTFVEWLTVAGLVLGSYGFVYAVPNKLPTNGADRL